MTRYLVTGGCGFIGSNFVRLLLRRDPRAEVVNLDALTYAGNPENLADLASESRYQFVRGNVEEPAAVRRALEGGADAVVHFAAESHVDRSLEDPAPFVRTNVLGTQVLLTECRRAGVGRFLLVSTDEVYGSLGPDGAFRETDPIQPSSPYSASKAAADLLTRAAFVSFGAPVLLVRCSNNYGPYQFPEKLIPFFLTRLFEDKPVPLYGDGQNVRDWLHVEDCCEGILRVLEAGRLGEVYNLGGGNERSNLQITRTLLSLLGKPESLITFVKDRPGHDRRYALDGTKAAGELGWRPRLGFDDGLARTVDWYRANEEWWKRILRGEYRSTHQASEHP
ncbi:MAG: dTDP-glucose 4,6-dehydratase [Planctomycetes bacterium]|nr:dTDP-glucose 4,6-dehydratase [Planctomycetota bacterium]